MDCGNFKKLELAMHKVEEEEISFMCSFLSGFAVMAIFSNSIEKLMNKSVLGRMKAPLVVLIAGRTEREFEYKQKVMEYLLKELKLRNIIGDLYTPNPIFYAEALRSNLGLHGFIATGGFQSSKGVADTAAVCLRSTKSNIQLKQEFIKKEAIANDFGEGTWMSSYESGHFFHMESPTMFDQTDANSVSGMAEYMDKSNQLDLLKHLGAPFFVEGNRMHELFGPHMSNYHIWLRKLKETFDPNNLSDSGFYISSSNSKNV
jgi:glycolate oxidase